MAMENLAAGPHTNVTGHFLGEMMLQPVNIQCHTLNKALHKTSEKVILAP